MTSTTDSIIFHCKAVQSFFIQSTWLFFHIHRGCFLLKNEDTKSDSTTQKFPSSQESDDFFFNGI